MALEGRVRAQLVQTCRRVRADPSPAQGQSFDNSFHRSTLINVQPNINPLKPQINQIHEDFDRNYMQGALTVIDNNNGPDLCTYCFKSIEQNEMTSQALDASENANHTREEDPEAQLSEFQMQVEQHSC